MQGDYVPRLYSALLMECTENVGTMATCLCLSPHDTKLAIKVMRLVKSTVADEERWAQQLFDEVSTQAVDAMAQLEEMVCILHSHAQQGSVQQGSVQQNDAQLLERASSFAAEYSESAGRVRRLSEDSNTSSSSMELKSRFW